MPFEYNNHIKDVKTKMKQNTGLRIPNPNLNRLVTVLYALNSAEKKEGRDNNPQLMKTSESFSFALLYLWSTSKVYSCSGIYSYYCLFNCLLPQSPILLENLHKEKRAPPSIQLRLIKHCGNSVSPDLYF